MMIKISDQLKYLPILVFETFLAIPPAYPNRPQHCMEFLIQLSTQKQVISFSY